MHVNDKDDAVLSIEAEDSGATPQTVLDNGTLTLKILFQPREKGRDRKIERKIQIKKERKKERKTERKKKKNDREKMERSMSPLPS